MTVAFEVTYRIKGDTGFCDSAIVIINDTESFDRIKEIIATNRMVPVDRVVDFHPVYLGAGSFWNIG